MKLRDFMSIQTSCWPPCLEMKCRQIFLRGTFENATTKDEDDEEEGQCSKRKEESEKTGKMGNQWLVVRNGKEANDIC